MATGCGTQHPLRALGGTRVLLAAAPTTPPCFRRWRRSSLLQRKNYFNFGVLKSLRAFQNPFFTGGVVEENGTCSAAFYESAALRETGSPSQSSLRDASSPKGRALGMAVQFPAKVQSLRVRPLPLGGAVERSETEGL